MQKKSGAESSRFASLTEAEVWSIICEEALAASEREPMLASFYHASILNHHTFAAAISFILADKLGSQTMPALMLREIFEATLAAHPDIEQAMHADIIAHRERDPACSQLCMPLLFFKGYHALQS